MNYIIIDDNEDFAKAFSEKLSNKLDEPIPEENIISLKVENSETLFNVLNYKIADNPSTIIFININYKIKQGDRGSQYGIELLIWMRINKINNHCVLYSFEELHNLLNRHPKHLIATSKGTSFLQLPIDKNYFEKLDLEKLSQSKVEEKNLKRTLEVYSDSKKLRHRLANVYGLWFMFNIHNTYFKNETLGLDIFSEEFTKNFNFLELHIATFLAKNTDSDSIKSKINTITNLKSKIRQKKPKILYIDDQADIGWARFLEKSVFGNQNNDFQTLIPKKESFENNKNLNTFFKDVKTKILNNNNFVDCVLLDLRLADETGNIDDLNSLSGIRLLKKIHQTFPSLPIIMFTASNKAKSVKKVIKCGAEGLWTKPGLDDLKNNEYYLDSYLELLTYVKESISKYKSKTEKFIINAQFKTEYIECPNSYPSVFKDVNIILTDSTFWCETSHFLVKNHESAKLLIDLKVENRKRFIVIDDVLAELFRHSKGDNSDLQNTSSYSLKVIKKYRGSGKIGSGFEDVEKAIRENVTYVLEKAKGNGFHVVSNTLKIHSYHLQEKEASKEVEKRNIENHKALHADDTFQMLISYYLKNRKNVLLITDDFNSNVPNIINTIGFKFGSPEKYVIPKEFDKEKKLLKININEGSCFIAHSKVLYEICKNGKCTIINIPK